MANTAHPNASPTSSPVLAPTPAPRDEELRRVVAQLWADRQAQAAAPPRAAAPPPLPKIRAPPVFRGTEPGFAIDEWIGELQRQFQYYAAAGTLATPQAQIDFALVHMSGAAAAWWSGLPADKKNAIHSWEHFTAALRSRFRPVQGAMLARQRLTKMRQRGGQSVGQFAHMFQTTLLPITDMSDADQVHHFVSSLLPHLAARVWRNPPATLSDAIQSAVQLEASGNFGRAATHSAPRHHNPNYTPHTTSAPMDINHLEFDDADDDALLADSADPPAPAAAGADMHTLLAQMQAMQHSLNVLQQRTPTPFRNSSSDRVPGLKPGEIDQLLAEGRCFRCKQKGHMKRDCPGPRGPAHKPQSSFR